MGEGSGAQTGGGGNGGTGVTEGAGGAMGEGSQAQTRRGGGDGNGMECYGVMRLQRPGPEGRAQPWMEGVCPGANKCAEPQARPGSHRNS